MARVVPVSFFARRADVVAPELLGKILVRQRGAEMKKYKIIEVEAYEGTEDRASHASRGRTPRTEVMFGEAGRWYVYLVYGMYEMLNVVTGEKGHPGAVLIRGIKILDRHIDGPGKLTKELQVTRALNAKRVAPESGLWIEQAPKISDRAIHRSPRIGVAYAGEWAKKKWRFVLKT